MQQVPDPLTTTHSYKAVQIDLRHRKQLSLSEEHRISASTGLQ